MFVGKEFPKTINNPKTITPWFLHFTERGCYLKVITQN